MVLSDGSRTGNIAWAGNQSLRGLVSRLTGSIAAGQTPWIIASALAVIVGITAAYLLDRAGCRVPAILVTALTGLLVSPISWDHHWVWIALAVPALPTTRWPRPAAATRKPPAGSGWRSPG